MSNAAEVGVTSRVSTRVRYPETDRMGVAYHANYFVWFELGRTELMRSLGFAYGELEDRQELFFPVIEATASYRRSARYDECIRVETETGRLSGARIRFDYRVLREADEELLATGHTIHAAVDGTGRPCRIPADLRSALVGGRAC